MALITRCPDCATAFRVTPLQLQAQGGDVRCGHCAHIFNGFATLATMQEPEAVDLSARKVPDITESNFKTPSVDDSLIAADQEISSQASGNETTQTEVITESPDREVPEPESAASKEPAPQISDTASAPGNYSAENYAPERYVPDDYAFGVAPSRKVSAAWGVASLFLLVVLAAQAIYFYRAELSAIMPATRPYLEQYCELLGCTIPLPQNAALLSIESSEMQADTPRSGLITLNATVRNYASYPQAFPSFELTLTDPQDQPLASHTFDPKASLGENMNSAGAIAPNHEFNVRLHLDGGDLNAAGYRVFLFYPGQATNAT